MNERNEIEDKKNPSGIEIVLFVVFAGLLLLILVPRFETYAQQTHLSEWRSALKSNKENLLDKKEYSFANS